MSTTHTHTYPFTPTIRATLLFTHDGRLRRPVPLLVRVWTAAHIHSRLALLEKMQLSSESALFSDCRQATHPHMHTCTHRPSRHYIRSRQPIPRRFTPDQYAEAIKCSNVWTHTHTRTLSRSCRFCINYQLQCSLEPEQMQKCFLTVEHAEHRDSCQELAYQQNPRKVCHGHVPTGVPE